MMNDDLLPANGIDASTGDYLLALSESDLARAACGEPLDEDTLSDLSFRAGGAGGPHYGVVEGVDVRALEESGWGVIFPASVPGSPEAAEDDAIYEALSPLLALRRSVATQRDERLYREYRGPNGYRRGESKLDFLSRLGAGPGPVNPVVAPYYLLLVGDPERIPYRVQSQIGVQYAVGRLHFDHPDDYAAYARSVVQAETQGARRPRRALFFGVANEGDRATLSSASQLVAPLADTLAADPRFAGWTVDRLMKEQATRSALRDVLNGPDAPALLFTASHGMGFRKEDPLQRDYQGALLCQDWPGPGSRERRQVARDWYLAGEDIDDNADLSGTMAFLFACYGAGTPKLDEFSKAAFKERLPIAPEAFVASLPKALLSRPKGGALAVIGHVERAWGASFQWPEIGRRGGASAQRGAFESTLRGLMTQLPVGAAMEYFDQRYAELASDLSVQIEDRDAGLTVNDYALASLWTASNDARDYAVLGDPAVRLPLDGPISPVPDPRQILEIRTPSPAPAEPSRALPAEPAGAFAAESSQDAAAGALPASLPEALADALARARERGFTLEISTWSAADLSVVRFDGERPTGATLRALTRMSLDGQTTVVLPESGGTLDASAWETHLQAMQEAWKARVALIEVLSSQEPDTRREG